tara:strand:- start:1062 stop:2111 length:1050 start_codon:yes stop_codon:yes gene_type:complete
MAFFTKVDYSRQLKQYSDTTLLVSGSTSMEQDLSVGSGLTVAGSISGNGEFRIYQPSLWENPAYSGSACSTCSACTKEHILIVGPHSATSASCLVAISTFSAVTGYTAVLSLGQTPMSPLTGGSLNPGISASTLQVYKAGLLTVGALGNSAVDLQIDEVGNVVRALPSSRRYKKDLVEMDNSRYRKLLEISPYSFTYKETGGRGFGLIAEELDSLGLNELVIYNGVGQPDNVEYKLLSVALLGLVKSLHSESGSSNEYDVKTKVVYKDYTTDGEYLLLVMKQSTVLLNSVTNKKIKIKSLSNVEILPDIGLIDDKWESLSLTGDSCVEFVFVDELSTWVIVSSDGLKES